jgi:hypothetical protein
MINDAAVVVVVVVVVVVWILPRQRETMMPVVKK